MKEEEIKKMIQKSGITTSEDFTDRLMDQLETKAVEETIVVWPFKWVLLGVVGLFGMIGYSLSQWVGGSSELFQMDLQSFKMPILIIMTLAFLLLVYRSLVLSDRHRQLKLG